MRCWISILGLLLAVGASNAHANESWRTGAEQIVQRVLEMERRPPDISMLDLFDEKAMFIHRYVSHTVSTPRMTLDMNYLRENWDDSVRQVVSQMGRSKILSIDYSPGPDGAINVRVKRRFLGQAARYTDHVILKPDATGALKIFQYSGSSPPP